MFTAENLKKGAFTFVIVLAALATHQLFISHKLKKSAPAVKA